jgi:DMSO reductase anchor subunit
MLETNGSISTLETATGLGSLGKVRSLMPPHTSENYLQKEMGFVIARRHAIKLRVISVLMGGLIPLFLLFLTPTSSIALGLAVLLHLCGVFVERWLFFAEAKHVVNLYYGD